MKTLKIDRSKHLCDEPHCGHNRWHPDIEAKLEVEEGEEIGIETRDSADGYIKPTTTIAEFAQFPLGALHPLTGPVNVKGAKPGDLLEVEFLDIQSSKWGFSVVFPGMGYLADIMTTPFIAHWDLADGWATSQQIPGVRLPGAPFMGVSGVAPSQAMLEAWTRRENDLNARGGMALPPDPNGAVPAGAAATAGLRTFPPRENGGNLDTKQLTKGAKLFLPVFRDGALFSTGDAHFTQGDGEVCLTAIEMASTAIVKFKIHKGAAEQRKIRSPYFQRDTFFADPKFATPERCIGTMGLPIDADGTQKMGDLNLATRNALLQMIERLQERGYTKEQAYVICSVAVDLRISQVVDIPNFVVTALLSEDIFAK
jgi:formamidase